MYEKDLNYDSVVVSTCYSELAQYYQVEGQHYFAFRAMYKSLEILYFTVPKNHPELATRLHSLSVLYSDLEIYDYSRDILEASLKISQLSHEENDPNVSFS